MKDSKSFYKKGFVVIIFALMVSFWFLPMSVSASGGDIPDDKRQEGEKIENAAPYDFSDVWLGSDDPWFILRTGDNVDYLVSKGFTQSLVNTLRLFVIMMSLVGALISVIGILFVTRSDQLKMKKDAIVHKLMIMFVVCSIIPAFNFMKWLFDTQFGM